MCDGQWRDIATAPKDRRVFFWVVPKVLGDDYVYADGTGKAILSDHKPYRHEGEWGSWGALSKPTHWMPLPDPPADEAPHD